MNQILSVEMPKSKKGSYRNKNSKKADIRTIIIFFCIILILFAMIIGVVAISIMNEKESGETQPGSIITGTQPEIIIFKVVLFCISIIISGCVPVIIIEHHFQLPTWQLLLIYLYSCNE